MTDIEARDTAEARPELRVIEGAPAAAPANPAVTQPLPAQTLIDAVTQLEANKKDLTPKGFQKRLQLSYAIFDQAQMMVQEIETQHAKLVSELVAVERRSPLQQARK